MSYHDHAYERSVIAWLQRLMLERVIAAETPPKEAVVCEEVFHAEREVPQEVLLRVLGKLGQWENHERTQMNNYRWVKEELPPFIKQAPPGQTPPQETPPAQEQPQAVAAQPQPAVAVPEKDSFNDRGPEGEDGDDDEEVEEPAGQDSPGEHQAGRERRVGAAGQ